MAAAIIFVLALLSSVPTINLQRSCQGAKIGALPEDQANAFQSCLHDEQAAKQTLQQKWSQIPAGARGSCVDEATGLSPSYVELLTCLEMRTGGNFSTGAAAVPTAAPATGSSAPLNPVQSNVPGTPGTGAGSIGSSPPTSALPGASAPTTSGGLRGTSAGSSTGGSTGK